MKNLDIVYFEQSSPEWHQARLGIVTASCVADALAKKGTATRASYMSELIAELMTGMSPEIKGAPLEWGKTNEPLARSAYEMSTGRQVEQVGFIYGKGRRVGASPDGLMRELEGGLELKCPYSTKNHIDFLLAEKIKSEYIYQVQFTLWITGAKFWDFGSFDPRMRTQKLKYITIEPDLKLFERFENEVGEFIVDMDNELEKLGVTFDQLKE